jgi:hypothetical protein
MAVPFRNLDGKFFTILSMPFHGNVTLLKTSTVLRQSK